MNIEKIAVNGGYVWVDKDAEVDINVWYYNNWCKGIFFNQDSHKTPIHLYSKSCKLPNPQFLEKNSNNYKIIAASPELKLEGVPTYVELLSEQFLIDVGFKVHKDLERDGWLKIGFIKGYQTKEKELSDELLTKYQEGMKKGLELSKELFTEYDVKKAIVMSATSPTDNLIDRCDEIVKHIKQSKK